MGCFSVFPCFTSSKHRNLNKSVNPTTSSSSINQENDTNCDIVLITLPTEESTNLSSFLRDNSDDHLINDSDNKAVTIDLDVETNAHISIVEDGILSVESEKAQEKIVEVKSVDLAVLGESENEEERENDQQNGKLRDLVHIENEKEKKKQKHENAEVHVDCEDPKKRNKESREENEGFHLVIKNVNKIEKEQKEENQSSGVQVVVQNERDGEEKTKTEENKTEVQNQALSDSSISSYISYPPMHRYHNCAIIEEEDQAFVHEDSSESLFSLSINPRKQSKSSPVEVNDEKEVNSPLKSSCLPKLNAESIGFSPDKMDSLLDPIENLAEWKMLKKRPKPASDHEHDKENVWLEQEETHIIPLSDNPSFEVSNRKGKLKTESEVNTSLSSWLIGPEKTKTASGVDGQFSTGDSYSCSDGATSWKSFEDRPILGAWTIDEVKQASARSSPRKSPCRNPDDTPIIGTVGSYWSHTAQGRDSSSSCSSPIRMSGKSRRYREKAASCHSSPLQRRLGK